MSGPEHYKEAERLLTEHEYETSADALAAAQVHATLALAAATARPAVKEWIGDALRDGSDWTLVTS